MSDRTLALREGPPIQELSPDTQLKCCCVLWARAHPLQQCPTKAPWSLFFLQSRFFTRRHATVSIKQLGFALEAASAAGEVGSSLLNHASTGLTAEQQLAMHRATAEEILDSLTGAETGQSLVQLLKVRAYGGSAQMRAAEPWHLRSCYHGPHGLF